MKPKILLIEDDPSLAAIYKAEFETQGFKTLIAPDGEEGLNLAKGESPTVIILDIMLPKIPGLSLLEKLKSEPQTQNIPAFILTNFGQEENVKQAFNLGAEDVFFKYQITPQEVVIKIKTKLEGGKKWRS